MNSNEEDVKLKLRQVFASRNMMAQERAEKWVEAVRESVLDPEKNAQEKIETFGDLVSQIQNSLTYKEEKLNNGSTTNLENKLAEEQKKRQKIEEDNEILRSALHEILLAYKTELVDLASKIKSQRTSEKIIQPKSSSSPSKGASRLALPTVSAFNKRASSALLSSDAAVGPEPVTRPGSAQEGDKKARRPLHRPAPKPISEREGPGISFNEWQNNTPQKVTLKGRVPEKTFTPQSSDLHTVKAKAQHQSRTKSSKQAPSKAITAPGEAKRFLSADSAVGKLKVIPPQAPHLQLQYSRDQLGGRSGYYNSVDDLHIRTGSEPMPKARTHASPRKSEPHPASSRAMLPSKSPGEHSKPRKPNAERTHPLPGQSKDSHSGERIPPVPERQPLRHPSPKKNQRMKPKVPKEENASPTSITRKESSEVSPSGLETGFSNLPESPPQEFKPVISNVCCFHEKKLKNALAKVKSMNTKIIEIEAEAKTQKNIIDRKDVEIRLLQKRVVSLQSQNKELRQEMSEKSVKQSNDVATLGAPVRAEFESGETDTPEKGVRRPFSGRKDNPEYSKLVLRNMHLERQVTLLKARVDRLTKLGPDMMGTPCAQDLSPESSPEKLDKLNSSRFWNVPSAVALTLSSIKADDSTVASWNSEGAVAGTPASKDAAEAVAFVMSDFSPEFKTEAFYDMNSKLSEVEEFLADEGETSCPSSAVLIPNENGLTRSDMELQEMKEAIHSIIVPRSEGIPIAEGEFSPSSFQLVQMLEKYLAHLKKSVQKLADDKRNLAQQIRKQQSDFSFVLQREAVLLQHQRALVVALKCEAADLRVRLHESISAPAEKRNFSDATDADRDKDLDTASCENICKGCLYKEINCEMELELARVKESLHATIVSLRLRLAILSGEVLSATGKAPVINPPEALSEDRIPFPDHDSTEEKKESDPITRKDVIDFLGQLQYTILLFQGDKKFKKKSPIEEILENMNNFIILVVNRFGINSTTSDMFSLEQMAGKLSSALSSSAEFSRQTRKPKKDSPRTGRTNSYPSVNGSLHLGGGRRALYAGKTVRGKAVSQSLSSLRSITPEKRRRRRSYLPGYKKMANEHIGHLPSLDDCILGSTEYIQVYPRSREVSDIEGLDEEFKLDETKTAFLGKLSFPKATFPGLVPRRQFGRHVSVSMESVGPELTVEGSPRSSLFFDKTLETKGWLTDNFLQLPENKDPDFVSAVADGHVRKLQFELASSRAEHARLLSDLYNTQDKLHEVRLRAVSGLQEAKARFASTEKELKKKAEEMEVENAALLVKNARLMRELADLKEEFIGNLFDAYSQGGSEGKAPESPTCSDSICSQQSGKSSRSREQQTQQEQGGPTKPVGKAGRRCRSSPSELSGPFMEKLRTNSTFKSSSEKHIFGKEPSTQTEFQHQLLLDAQSTGVLQCQSSGLMHRATGSGEPLHRFSFVEYEKENDNYAEDCGSQNSYDHQNGALSSEFPTSRGPGIWPSWRNIEDRRARAATEGSLVLPSKAMHHSTQAEDDVLLSPPENCNRKHSSGEFLTLHTGSGGGELSELMNRYETNLLSATEAFTELIIQLDGHDSSGVDIDHSDPVLLHKSCWMRLGAAYQKVKLYIEDTEDIKQNLENAEAQRTLTENVLVEAQNKFTWVLSQIEASHPDFKGIFLKPQLEENVVKKIKEIREENETIALNIEGQNLDISQKGVDSLMSLTEALNHLKKREVLIAALRDNLQDAEDIILQKQTVNEILQKDLRTKDRICSCLREKLRLCCAKRDECLHVLALSRGLLSLMRHEVQSHGQSFTLFARHIKAQLQWNFKHRHSQAASHLRPSKSLNDLLSAESASGGQFTKAKINKRKNSTSGSNSIFPLPSKKHRELKDLSNSDVVQILSRLKLEKYAGAFQTSNITGMKLATFKESLELLVDMEPDDMSKLKEHLATVTSGDFFIDSPENSNCLIM